jgi:hypothetical protein
MIDAEFVREVAQPLTRGANDYDSLLDLSGDSREVFGTRVNYPKPIHSNFDLRFQS